MSDEVTKHDTDTAIRAEADRLSSLSPTNRSLIRVEKIVKRFPGVVALDNVDFELRPGEIHAIVGQNGAGKSTLINIMSGVYRADGGTISMAGHPVNFRSPRDSQAAGIATIYQEIALAPHLTVYENLVLGQEPEHFPGWLNRAAAVRRCRDHLRSFGVNVDPNALVEVLPLAERQLVAMGKALAFDARILILDEPTAVLSESEVARLFEVLRRLRGTGVGIIYVSHRLEELRRIGDRVTVLRDGHCIATADLNALPLTSLIEMMVGRDVGNFFEEPGAPGAEVWLRISDLSARGAFMGVSLSVRSGEIVAITGLIGSGKERLAQALFGDLDGVKGTVELHGRPVHYTSPAGAIRAGVGYVPADRKTEGLVLDRGLTENITLATLARYSRSFLGLLRHRLRTSIAKKWIDVLQIRGPALGAPLRLYSGGNQHKVVLGKWLDARSSVLIMVEPTTGLDVGAKVDVYRLIRHVAAQGAAVLIISSDLPEVVGLSHRTLVMREGRIVAEFLRGSATQHELLYQTVVGEGPNVNGSIGN